jgi:hypothetical protein
MESENFLIFLDTAKVSRLITVSTGYINKKIDGLLSVLKGPSGQNRSALRAVPLQRSSLLVTSSNDTCYINVNIYLDFLKFKEFKVLGRLNKKKPILSPYSGEGRFVWGIFLPIGWRTFI